MRVQAEEALVAALRDLMYDVESSVKLAAAPAAAAAARAALVPTMRAPSERPHALVYDRAGFRTLYGLRYVAQSHDDAGHCLSGV